MDLYEQIKRRHSVMLGEIEEAILLHHLTVFRADLISGLRTVRDLVNYICEVWDITPEELVKKDRKRDYVEPRQVATWALMNNVLGNNPTLNKVAVMFNQNHATSLHSKRTVPKDMQTNAVLRDRVMALLNHFGFTTNWDPIKKELTFYKEVKKSDEE